MTPSNPSELPLVLIVATIGLSSQILVNFSARSIGIAPPEGDRSTRTMSHPATTSARAKSALPEENHATPGQAVGIRSQASSGVYRYVSRW